MLDRVKWGEEELLFMFQRRTSLSMMQKEFYGLPALYSCLDKSVRQCHQGRRKRILSEDHDSYDSTLRHAKVLKIEAAGVVGEQYLRRNYCSPESLSNPYSTHVAAPMSPIT